MEEFEEIKEKIKQIKKQVFMRENIILEFNKQEQGFKESVEE